MDFLGKRKTTEIYGSDPIKEPVRLSWLSVLQMVTKNPGMNVNPWIVWFRFFGTPRSKFVATTLEPANEKTTDVDDFWVDSNYETYFQHLWAIWSCCCWILHHFLTFQCCTNIVVQLFFRTILIYVSIHSGLRSSLTAVASWRVAEATSIWFTSWIPLDVAAGLPWNR